MKPPVINRFFEIPKLSFFLLGPRGTGKSTWLKKNFEDKALLIDLLKPDIQRTLNSYPERLFDMIAANTNKKIIIIDEIQKAPELLTVVHSILEEKNNYQFILTGSSARKLKNTQANLLGGRALRCIMHPFVAAELGDNFSLEVSLKNGLLPLTYQKQNEAQDILQAYINLYLKEEIHAEGVVRNLENFTRFLEVMTFSHASIINTTNIAAECQVKRKTVENYIDILEDFLLGFHLPVFTKKAKRELTAHPKFYFFDPGVFYALRPKGPLDKPEEIEGASLEGLVAQHLRAWTDFQKESYTLSFWRTRSGVEVDFVVYGPDGIWAIEVKNSAKIGLGDTKSLQSFLEDYPMAKGILLYRGKERIMQKSVLCLPCEEFLLQLRPNKFTF
ncbi:MAG: AAA family ATPase [Bdellovibrionota bacterium]